MRLGFRNVCDSAHEFLPNDPKLSDSPGWRDRCTVGERRRQEAAGVTAGRVRCSAWLNQSLREAVLARVVVFVDGEMLMEQAWMLLW